MSSDSFLSVSFLSFLSLSSLCLSSLCDSSCNIYNSHYFTHNFSHFNSLWCMTVRTKWLSSQGNSLKFNNVPLVNTSENKIFSNSSLNLLLGVFFLVFFLLLLFWFFWRSVQSFVNVEAKVPHQHFVKQFGKQRHLNKIKTYF